MLFGKGSVMNAAITVIKEQLEHFYLTRRLSLYELKSKNKSNYLGMAWEIINPVIQILIYWFVFGSIRQRADIEVIPGMNVPFIYWLLGGFIVWNFFYQSTIQGSKSIYSRLRIVSKMNFPLSVIPNIDVFSQFFLHIIMVTITFFIFQLSGYTATVYFLQLFYFNFAALSLIFSISLITSTLSTMVRDVHMFLNSILRMLLYLSPILWQVTILEEPLPIILKLNPLYYLIEGYRSAFFGLDWYFIVHWRYSLYFWFVVTVLFLIGSALHVKFRRYFIDYL